MLGWLRTLLCGGILRELDECHDQCSIFEAEITKLYVENGSLKDRIEALENCIGNIDELKAKILKLSEDCAYYEERVENLTEALSKSIQIPYFEIDESELIVVKVAEEDVFKAYDDFVFADLEYYLLPKEKWLEILPQIQAQVKYALKWFQYPVSDCDDYAYVMGAFTTIAFRKAGLDRQGAFMITWQKNKHAYNAYMDTEGRVWIYEPQSGRTVGELGETEDPYDTDMIWIPGVEV